MSAASNHQHHSLASLLAEGATDRNNGYPDHTLADDAVLTREFACLASVSHVTLAGVRELRRIPGVTGFVDDADTAELRLLIHAQSARDAKRVCVELVADAVPEAIVSVPEVVDYETALVDYLDRRLGLAGAESDDADHASFDDIMAIADALDT